MQGVANSKVPVLPVVHMAQVVGTAATFVIVGVVAGSVLMLLIRWRGWAWTCGVPLAVGAPYAPLLGWHGGVCYCACAVATVGGGLWRHLLDLRAGGDLADHARDRAGPMAPIRRWYDWRKLRTGQWVTSQGVAIGFSRKGELVRIPIAGRRSIMGLVLGATGAGKTVLLVLCALAAIRRGEGVVFIDPKGDDFVLEELRSAAARAGRRCLVLDPRGQTLYNPYARGWNTEIADKLIATEVYTEPHYLRLAQRYLGHVVRALRLAGEEPVSLARVVEHLNPGRLSSLTRKMSPSDARPLLDYLESITTQQERDLAGTRDRLAILADSDMGHLLEPTTGGLEIDLHESLERGDVVLFRLEADRRPLAAPMLGAAIIQDLVAITDERQHGEHRPGLVIIDEFSAFGADQVARLFGRARGAKLSVLLGSQEASDLGSTNANVGEGAGILAQVVGNVEVLLSGRQNMPASAELVAAIAGTRGAWITTQQTNTTLAGLLTGLGSRSRGREYAIHPDRIKSLGVGEIAAIEPISRRAIVVRVFHPDELRRHGVEC